MTEEELEPIAEFAKEHDIVVISDTIYSNTSWKITSASHPCQE